MIRWLVAAALLAVALPAAAKSSRDVSYGYDPVFAALVRFLRVDEKLKLVEKDPAAGYVLFELSENKKIYNGAAEVMKAQDGAGRPVTRIILRLSDRPAYMEAGMLDRLEAKLREELGEPTSPGSGDEKKP